MKIKTLIILCLILIVELSISFTRKNNSNLLLNENIISENNLAVYIQNESGEYSGSSDIPLKDSGYKFSKAVCKDDVNVSWDNELWGLQTTSNIANISCSLYFDKNGVNIQDILASKTINERTDFSTTLTADTTGIVYNATDNDGTSYYYAGSPTDNWVKFAEYYWRIIRINGDGTIRLIYNGTSTTTTGTGTQIGTGAFNSTTANNMYVGYMYTSGSIHGTGTSSTIKNTLDTWYKNNLSNYSTYIDIDAGFCNDRNSSTSASSLNGSGGTGTAETYYAGYIRLYTNKAPTLKCTSSYDLFTSISSSKGNKALTYPIGLITSDEVAYSGGVWGINNTNYFIYNNQAFWTMTPVRYTNNNCWVFRLYNTGALATADGSMVTSSFGIRPVINLRADVTLTGSGTSTDPYIVS